MGREYRYGPEIRGIPVLHTYLDARLVVLRQRWDLAEWPADDPALFLWNPRRPLYRDRCRPIYYPWGALPPRALLACWLGDRMAVGRRIGDAVDVFGCGRIPLPLLALAGIFGAWRNLPPPFRPWG